MEVASSDSMNTPIKKIQELSIASPNIKQIMVDKGYSNSISDKVLNEINYKLQEIPSSPVHDGSPEPQDQFSKMHNLDFSKMESIMNHYSMKRMNNYNNNSTKKRRTLTGIEETNSSPLKGKISPSKKSMNLNELLHNTNHPSTIHSNDRKFSFPRSKTPSPYKNNTFAQRPKLPTLQSKSSIPRLQKNTSATNLTPGSPLEKKPSSSHLNRSLEKKPSSSHLNRSLEKKPSSSHLNRSLEHKPSSNHLNRSLEKKPSTSHLDTQSSLNKKVTNPQKPVPRLQSKSSIPQLDKQNPLQKKPSIPQLQKKSSIPQLQKKTSIPQLNKEVSSTQLQKKPSIPQLNNPQLQKKSSIPQLQKKSSIPQLQKKPSTSQIQATTFAPQLQSKTNTPQLEKQYLTSQAKLSTKPEFKEPYPKREPTFNKPTVSSSQKSLDKFMRFKTRFS